ncbi:MAG: PD-(D/E)XK nuclease family protein [Spirochaetaceae bacterium]|nr:PD-(D/E)XK nuclease family protein [Spirochaetaceae bacterium]
MDVYEFIKNFLDKKEKNASLLRYNLNIIDELHADENAHTRILLKLLDYNLGEKKVILEEFLNQLNEKLPNQKIPLLDDYRITGQFAYIDGYIRSDSAKVAVIIENKINWAEDQKEQIQRYIESAKNDGINEKNIFVVYLTYNGVKKVSDYSLTPKAKEMLDWKDVHNQGRYIEVNYREDILPFLHKIFDNFGFSKESVLKSAIFQYIDYLEGRFGIRKSEKEFNKAMSEDLLKILNIDDNLSRKEKLNKIEEIEREISESFGNLKNEIYPWEDRPEGRLDEYLGIFKDKKGPFKNCSIWEGWLLSFTRCEIKNREYDIKFEICPADDETVVTFKCQEEIEDENFIKNILEEMGEMKGFKLFNNTKNDYRKNIDISETKNYIENFIEKFEKYVKKENAT